MNRTVLCLLLCLLLVGCAAAPAAEVFYVEDREEPSAEAAAAPPEPAYVVSFSVPEDATLAADATDGATVCKADDGSYTIAATVLPGLCAADALRVQTGLSPQALRPLCTERLGMPFYRYVWCEQCGEQTLVCTGALYEDADCCYCLCFCAAEDAVLRLREIRDSVLESFSLNADEGF